jgi:hypothetical protein
LERSEKILEEKLPVGHPDRLEATEILRHASRLAGVDPAPREPTLRASPPLTLRDVPDPFLLEGNLQSDAAPPVGKASSSVKDQPLAAPLPPPFAPAPMAALHRPTQGSAISRRPLLKKRPPRLPHVVEIAKAVEAPPATMTSPTPGLGLMVERMSRRIRYRRRTRELRFQVEELARWLEASRARISSQDLEPGGLLRFSREAMHSFDELEALTLGTRKLKRDAAAEGLESVAREVGSLEEQVRGLYISCAQLSREIAPTGSL